MNPGCYGFQSCASLNFSDVSTTLKLFMIDSFHVNANVKKLLRMLRCVYTRHFYCRHLVKQPIRFFPEEWVIFSFTVGTSSERKIACNVIGFDSDRELVQSV